MKVVYGKKRRKRNKGELHWRHRKRPSRLKKHKKKLKWREHAEITSTWSDDAYFLKLQSGWFVEIPLAESRLGPFKKFQTALSGWHRYYRKSQKG